jgi:hypothetical protein
MITTSYFRIQGAIEKVSKYVFFNDNDYAATEAAFARASSFPGTISAWRPPKFPGPWDDAIQIIGHRRKYRIVMDLSSSDPEVVERARSELYTLESEIKQRRETL